MAGDVGTESVGSPALRLSRAQLGVIVTHCLDGFPDEACGLLSGPLDADGEITGEIADVHPCENAAHSAKLFRIGARDLFRAGRAAEDAGTELVSVWHSHTHTDAYPSPTDLRQATEMQQLERPWIWTVVSLRFGTPVVRAYWMRDGTIVEIPVEVADTGETPVTGMDRR